MDGTGLSARGSIVIPAHNEEAVIARTLRPLAALATADVEVVVVANGCTDATADIARAVAPGALVLETPVPSKVHALRLAEEASASLPRLYVDADVQITERAAVATLDALAAGATAARPPFRYDTRGATAPVRRYYRARSAMPSMRAHAWGAGVYGLSAEARSRFGEFPDVVGDDLWVDRMLAPGELVVVDTDPVVVITPKDSASLLRVLRRAQRGKADPAASGAGGGTATSAGADLARSVRSPRAVVDAVVYLGFAVAARLRSRGPGHRWERDESSRTIAAGVGR